MSPGARASSERQRQVERSGGIYTEGPRCEKGLADIDQSRTSRAPAKLNEVLQVEDIHARGVRRNAKLSVFATPVVSLPDRIILSPGTTPNEPKKSSGKTGILFWALGTIFSATMANPTLTVATTPGTASCVIA